MSPPSDALRHPSEGWHVHDDDPFAGPGRLPEGASAEDLSRFGDPRWYLSALSQRSSEGSQVVSWDLFPEQLRASFRRAGWALVNLSTPAELLERAATRRAEWPRPATMAAVFLGWRRFAGWLTDRGVGALDELSAEDLADYAAHVGQRPCSTPEVCLTL
jgi:hypothetical protein